ncbi:hypothetical protein F5Y16DRAFT_46266 [Xylariaceae sp. FL0255]|nr:hypothetical protein F5Y16DRAFT_46266 [Xylariaceae sp. FL0255]
MLQRNTTPLSSVLSASALTLLSFAPTAAVAQCARTDLIAETTKLLVAQTAGDPTILTTSSVPYQEQLASATLTTGILATPVKIDFNRSIYDTTQCATYTEIIAATQPHPYVIGTQMWFTPNTSATTTPTLANVSTLVTDAGDWAFNATGTLYWSSREDWSEIPEAQRDSRATILAAANAYADVFNNASVAVPWGTPCDRLEGGSYTGNGSPTDSCDVGVPTGVSITDRQFVIDETVGSVDMFDSFASLPDSHEFRLLNGKLRYVHSITVM